MVQREAERKPEKARRRTAEERRDEVIDAAIIEFATFGLHGASTEAIAARAGISQPYVLRLFGTKKALFLAAVERVCEQIMATWQRGLDACLARDAHAGPEDRLLAMGQEYIGLVGAVDGLRLVLQSFSSAEDTDVRESAHRWLGTMFDWVRRVSGADAETVRHFFATGMMLTVAASIRASDAAHAEPWARAFLMQPID
ncbi:MAG TPA: helix-turn-helix domain-containing protein [Thermomicrobiales bacterium]|nr:helix-turn-helix domain-containing protein [Thermomicrobiales bacterium]